MSVIEERPSATALSNEQRELLRLALEYGGNLALGGPRVGKHTKEVARSLIRLGYLDGHIGSLILTDRGHAVAARLKILHPAEC